MPGAETGVVNLSPSLPFLAFHGRQIPSAGDGKEILLHARVIGQFIPGLGRELGYHGWRDADEEGRGEGVHVEVVDGSKVGVSAVNAGGEVVRMGGAREFGEDVVDDKEMPENRVVRGHRLGEVVSNSSNPEGWIYQAIASQFPEICAGFV